MAPFPKLWGGTRFATEEWVQGVRLRDQFVRVRVRELRRAGPASAMFRVA